MLTSVTLANYRSFGAEQTVPLRPITVLVGPNNSGKSTFLELFGTLADLTRDATASTAAFASSAFHRPQVGSELVLSATSDVGVLRIRMSPSGEITHGALNMAGGRRVWNVTGSRHIDLRGDSTTPRWSDVQRFLRCFDGARLVRLDRLALRSDSNVGPEPRLGADGLGLASVIGMWRGLDDDRFRRLEEFVARCAPEVSKILAKPVEGGRMRLVIEQRDRQQFEAADVSDGILHLIGLAAHAVDAPHGAILCIEEPEAAIHPRRLIQYVELLHAIVAETDCQVILATHSPVLVRAFKDEPESVVHFSRGPGGTVVRRLTDMPRAMQALDEGDADLGELFAGGFLTQEAQV
jgi:predicted ATPase